VFTDMIPSQINSDFLRYAMTHGGEPGTYLPPLSQISSETNISVGKLREQLEVARVLGLVEVKPRLGIRWLGYDFLPAVRLSLMVALALEPHTFNAFSTLRIHLETAFWDEAVVRLTAADKAHLQALVASAWAKLNHKRIQIPHPEHRSFHLSIFSRLENPFVLGLLEAYWDAYEAVDLNTYADYRYLTATWTYHKRIANAISEGSYAEGKELLAEHMHLINQMGVAAQELLVNTNQVQGET